MLRLPQHRVGGNVAQVGVAHTLTGSGHLDRDNRHGRAARGGDGPSRRVQRHLGLGYDRRGKGSDIVLHRLDDLLGDQAIGLHRIVECPGGDSNRATGVVERDDVALLIEVNDEPADVLVSTAGGDDRDLGSVGVGGDHRIGQDRYIPGNEQVVWIGQQLVAAARHHDVNSVQHRGERNVLLDALQLGDHDDLVHAQVSQTIDLGLNGGEDRGGYDVARAGDSGQQLGRGTHEAKRLTPLLDDGAANHAIAIDQLVEDWLTGEVEIGAHEGRLGVEALHEIGEDLGPEVELVIADGTGVVTDLVHGDGVVIGNPLVETGLELGAGQIVVPRGHHQRNVVPTPIPLTLQVLCHGGKRGDTREGLAVDESLEQGRFAVVVVQQRQRDIGARLLLRGGRCSRHH